MRADTAPFAPPAGPVAEAFLASALCWAGTVAAGVLGVRWGALAVPALAGALVGHMAFLGLALARLRRGGAPAHFGAANRITLARTALVALLGATAVAPPVGAAALWSLVAVAVLALVLDGFDGAAARRAGNVSRFGAWFDQEVDALFVLVLSVFVWRSGEAGPWILAAGAWRYAFLILAATVPRFGGELPYSQRRRVVCVVQLATLVACVSPLFDPPLSTALAAASLTVLTASFTLDLALLWRSSDASNAAPRTQHP
ncbi:MAG: CDP-alcohol phosphatidyltransferase family protein [Planctomycetota bacterium]